MKNDLSAALRLVRSQPWFAAAIILTLAFAIGINTTVFTIANAVLYKEVPLPNGDRLVTVSNHSLKRGDKQFNLSYPEFETMRQQTESLEALEATASYQAIISESGVAPERFSAAHATAGLFPMLGIQPVAGRPFNERDFREGSDRTAYISYSVWKTRYGLDPDAVGGIVSINNQAVEIIGVMPDGFRFPSQEDVWTPYFPGEEREDRSSRRLQAFGLLNPGVSIGEANGEIALFAANIAQAHPETNENIGADVLTFHDRYNGGPIGIIFLAMLGATGFVLMIACSNVANMLLSRSLARRQEISIRAALGARRSQIVRQLLVESVTLSLLGGLLGLAITAFGVHAFDLATQSVGKPYWILFEIDYRVFAYFAIVSIGSGLLFGIGPALRTSRIDLNTVLKEGARGSDSRQTGRLSGALVALQFAMTFVLLTGAGLMLRSFFAAQDLNSFLPADSTLVASIAVPAAKGERYEDPSTRRVFFHELEKRLEQIPGVETAVLTNYLPGLGSATRNILIDGRPNDETVDPPQVSLLTQTKNYFSLIGLPIREGRTFLDTDNESNQLVAIASQEFVDTHWPDESGLGKRFAFDEKDKPADWITIVGVASDIVQQSRKDAPPPLVYVPHSQRPWAYMNVMLRVDGDPLALSVTLKNLVQELDTNLPVFDVQTLGQAQKHNYWFLNVFGTLFLSFAAIGLAMASVGIYATVAQSTARRVQEIGIRLALGSSPGGILRLVLRRGLIQMAIGLTAGVGIAYSTTHMLEGLMFRISPRDPIVFSVSIGLLVAIGFVASWLPARRAAQLSPTEALRDQ